MLLIFLLFYCHNKYWSYKKFNLLSLTLGLQFNIVIKGNDELKMQKKRH